MRVAVDATPLLGARTGVGVMVDALLRAFVAAPELGVEPIAYALSLRGGRGLGAVVPKGVDVATRPSAAGPLLRVWRIADAPTFERIAGREADVVHGTNFVVPPTQGAARVVTVHDLTALRFPHLCAPSSLRYPELVQRAASQGAWVHTPSESVRDEVIRLLGVRPERVRAVHHGVAVPEQTGDAELGHALAGAERYVLALGTVEPRKGLPTLVDAVDRAAADVPGLTLVVAGPDGWGVEAFRSAVAAVRNARVVRLGWVSERDRVDLLAGASCFAYPSLYEGFGFPPLEAMAAGVPVVASTAGSLPEVLGDGAVLVPPADPRALAAALVEVLLDDRRAATLVERGRARAARFTWRAAAEAVVGLHRDAVAAR